MVHYIYKIIFLRGYPTGRYYIGKRSFGGDDISKDNYLGSGVFCKDYFLHYGKIFGDTYIKEILEINPSEEINSQREKIIIGDLYKSDDLCMNIMSGGRGGSNCEMREVYQYDLEGNLVGKYQSQCKAAEATGIKSSGISKSCIYKNITAGGYIWRFTNEPLTKSELKYIKIHSRPIRQYTEDLKFIKEWKSIKEASIALKIQESSIGAICNHTNKSRHTAGGYVWSFSSEVPIIKKEKNYRGTRRVNQYDLQGILVATYKSISDAANAVNGKWQCIQRCCNKRRLKAYGFIWRFDGDIIDKSIITKLNFNKHKN